MTGFKRDTLEVVKEVIEIEADAIRNLSLQIGREMELLVEEIINTSGKVVVCGMGKSGIIGRKISATLSSTGTSSFFLHPAEAFHGDLGALGSKDILLLLSYSGETEEVVRLLPYANVNCIATAAITGAPDSILAKNCKFHLNASVALEACPLQLAPTSSTTASLVVGDALAVALMEKRGFKNEDFAQYHPGGSLGKRLLTNAQEIMIPVEDLLLVHEHDPLVEVIEKLVEGDVGIVVVQNNLGCLEGVISSGDFMRALKTCSTLSEMYLADLITREPVTCQPDQSLNDILYLMQDNAITSVVVVGNDNQIFGLVHQKLIEI